MEGQAFQPVLARFSRQSSGMFGLIYTAAPADTQTHPARLGDESRIERLDKLHTVVPRSADRIQRTRPETDRGRPRQAS